MKFRDKNNIVLAISAFLVVLAVIIAVVATTVEKKRVTSQTTEAPVVQTTNKKAPATTKTDAVTPDESAPVESTQAVVDTNNVPGKYIVITQEDPLAMRSNPDADSQRISELPKDSEVTVLATYDNWAYVAKDDVNGWVKKDFIKLSEKAEAPEHATGKYTINTESDALGMRSKPDSNAERVGEIAKGKEVDVLTVCGDWGFIKVDDTYGWASIEFMKKN